MWIVLGLLLIWLLCEMISRWWRGWVGSCLVWSVVGIFVVDCGYFVMLYCWFGFWWGMVIYRVFWWYGWGCCSCFVGWLLG